MPVVEAMASFCPVVAADIPALREICGDAALFCNPMLSEDIADRVCQILDDNKLQTTLRNAGLERTRGMTWSRAAQVLREIILERFGDVS